MWQPNDDDPYERTEVWRDDEDDPVEEHTASWQPEQQPSNAPLLAWLVVVLPPEKRGMMVELGPNIVVGRGGDSDIRWDDERLSRQHARFWLGLDSKTHQPAYFVTPLEARKPIEVNQQPISATVRLNENDRLLLGDTLFVVKLLE